MKYRTIVIDPPWGIKPTPSRLFDHEYTQSKIPYKTMSDDELKQFPIDLFTDKNCDLFMWTIHQKLPLALELLQTWKFKYYCVITWHKSHTFNLNGFTRNSELLVYGYKGKSNRRYKSPLMQFVYKCKSTKHSEKPSEMYDAIRTATMPPRIDIFARKRHKGFDAYGDQVESELQETLT